jgi:mRNA interferase RelE/StbE
LVYKIEIRKQATRELARIARKDGKKIVAAIDDLADDPRPAGCKKLGNREGWRIRVGEYRIIYSIEDEKLMILVVRTGHRRDVYR